MNISTKSKQTVNSKKIILKNKSTECKCRLKILQNNYYDVNSMISRNFRNKRINRFNPNMIAIYGLNQNGRNLGNF